LQENKAKKLTSERLRRNRRTKKELMADPCLERVQQKLMDVIGSYSLVMDIDYEYDKVYELSAEEPFLKYSLPLSDMKPDMCLGMKIEVPNVFFIRKWLIFGFCFSDYLLPRVLDLCHTASDRQTRSSACEFLHTFTLYFIGYCKRFLGAYSVVQNNQLNCIK